MPDRKEGKRRAMLVITDVDNTLVDTRLRDYRSFADTAMEWGLRMQPFPWFSRQRLAGASSREIGVAIHRLNGESFDLSSFLRERHDRLDRPALFSLDTPVTGAVDGLARLHEAGVVVVAATLRAALDALSAELARLGLAGYLTDMVTRDVVPVTDAGPYGTDFETLMRYKRAVLSVALHRHGERASETVFVTDTAFDLVAARGLGMRRIAVRTGYAAESDLQAESDVVVDDFGQVPEVLGITE